MLHICEWYVLITSCNFSNCSFAYISIYKRLDSFSALFQKNFRFPSLCSFQRTLFGKSWRPLKIKQSKLSLTILSVDFSLERRWSSRTFRYGYLVTTSPQSLVPPSTASSLRLDHRLRVLPTFVVWRAVCTRPGNVFTAACWSAITSDSDFMQASCSLQSELRMVLRD